MSIITGSYRSEFDGRDTAEVMEQQLEGLTTTTLERLRDTLSTERIVCTGMWGRAGEGCLLAASCTNELQALHDSIWEGLREEFQDCQRYGDIRPEMTFLEYAMNTDLTERYDEADFGRTVMESYDEDEYQLEALVTAFDLWAGGASYTSWPQSFEDRNMTRQVDDGKGIMVPVKCLTPAARTELVGMIDRVLASRPVASA